MPCSRLAAYDNIPAENVLWQCRLLWLKRGPENELDGMADKMASVLSDGRSTYGPFYIDGKDTCYLWYTGSRNTLTISHKSSIGYSLKINDP